MKKGPFIAESDIGSNTAGKSFFLYMYPSSALEIPIRRRKDASNKMKNVPKIVYDISVIKNEVKDTNNSSRTENKNMNEQIELVIDEIEKFNVEVSFFDMTHKYIVFPSSEPSKISFNSETMCYDCAKVVDLYNEETKTFHCYDDYVCDAIIAYSYVYFLVVCLEDEDKCSNYLSVMNLHADNKSNTKVYLDGSCFFKITFDFDTEMFFFVSCSMIKYAYYKDVRKILDNPKGKVLSLFDFLPNPYREKIIDFSISGTYFVITTQRYAYIYDRYSSFLPINVLDIQNYVYSHVYVDNTYYYHSYSVNKVRTCSTFDKNNVEIHRVKRRDDKFLRKTKFGFSYITSNKELFCAYNGEFTVSLTRNNDGGNQDVYNCSTKKISDSCVNFFVLETKFFLLNYHNDIPLRTNIFGSDHIRNLDIILRNLTCLNKEHVYVFSYIVINKLGDFLEQGLLSQARIFSTVIAMFKLLPQVEPKCDFLNAIKKIAKYINSKDDIIRVMMIHTKPLLMSFIDKSTAHLGKPDGRCLFLCNIFRNIK